MNVVWKEEYNRLTRKRIFWLYALLSILTGGVYSFFYYYKYIKDINMVCEGDGQESPSIFVYIILYIITFGIYPFFWTYKQQNRMKRYGETHNLDTKESSGRLVIIEIIGYVVGYIVTLVAMFISPITDFLVALSGISSTTDFLVMLSGTYTVPDVATYAYSMTQIVGLIIGSLIFLSGFLYASCIMIKNINILVENVFKSKPNT